MKTVVVIGAGAAGMMAALAAAKQGAKVILLEQNEKLGKKLFITGKGRCNVTNGADMDQLFANVCTNEKFLYSAFYGFDNQAVMAFFAGAGCPLKTERGERVFPVSDHSSDVISALARELKKAGVEICLRTTVSGLQTQDTDGGIRLTGVVCKEKGALPCDAAVLCTGGVSYPSTGSTGDGHRFAGQLGHQVTALRPALVPLETQEGWCRELMGLSLKNVSVTMTSAGREIYQGFGEMLFTHFGVSGPLILSASSFYAKQKKDRETKLYIDLKPALTVQQLDKRLLRDFEGNQNKHFQNVLSGLFPARLIPVMVALSGIDPQKRVNEITRAERNHFAESIKRVELTVTGSRSFAEAIITQGGVSVREVNPSTMESKKVKNLYLAGELLDVDALTGGFNLQIAWSTGHLAGTCAGKETEEKG